LYRIRTQRQGDYSSIDLIQPPGYRHLFPTPDTGPTPEQRERQRALDQLKGFAYFDTFDQLESWTSYDVYSTQRANTPLLKRPPIVGEARGKANVLLCHDYSGNYHDYETAQGVEVDEESYSCEYLQFVDTFVYFSHKLACVPPPSWTNSLHRNGVKVLGTILMEPQTRGTERLLEGSVDTGKFQFARKLADIACYYGFDGWLVNIEKPFPTATWDPLVMEAFLRQLRDDLGADRQVIWSVPWIFPSRLFINQLNKSFLLRPRYDALTTSNKISYQNALTPLNLAFIQACGSILTNYCWRETDALSSKQLAISKSIHSENIFFGVDVWAQNTTALTHPRTTYGGGGTKTGLAVTKLAEVGLSVGVFAPAWSFEHFPTHGREIERATWDGHALPENVNCGCGNASRQHPSNRRYPVTRYAQEFPAGSESFFYTNFSRAFARRTDSQTHLWGGKALHSQLASQSLLPHLSNTGYSTEIENSINNFSMHLEDLPGWTKLVVEARSLIPTADASPEDNVNGDIENPKLYENCLRIFKLNITSTKPLRLRIVYDFLLDDPTIWISAFYIQCSGGVGSRKFFNINRPGKNIIEAYHTSQVGSIDEIGFHLIGPQFGEIAARVIEITEMCLCPTNSHSVAYSIGNIRIESRGEGETRHKRLCWNISGEDENTDVDSGIPYSEVTGPFSYFTVQAGGFDLGKAYALEYVLSEALVERLGKEDDVKVKILGVGFDGREICENWVELGLEI
jgi:hypothetical protein